MEEASQNSSLEHSIHDEEAEQQERPLHLEKRTHPIIPHVIQDPKQELRPIERRDRQHIEEREDEVDLHEEPEKKQEEVVCRYEMQPREQREDPPRKHEEQHIRQGPCRRDERWSPPPESQTARIKRHRLSPPKSHEEQHEESKAIDVGERIQGEAPRARRSIVPQEHAHPRVRRFMYSQRKEDGGHPSDSQGGLVEDEIKRHMGDHMRIITTLPYHATAPEISRTHCIREHPGALLTILRKHTKVGTR